MTHSLTRRAALGGAVAAAAMVAAPALAQQNFYEGKRITMVVGAPPTGSYAAYSRILANHLPKHVPGNPTIELDFRGGGDGGLGTSTYMEDAAPDDGTFLAITQQTIPVNQFLDPNAPYDVTTWKWIGGMAPIRNMLALWHTAPAQSIEEAKETPVRVGATGTSSPMFIVPKVMNELMGTQFEIILGYDGIAGANLAMEQGEVHGRGASWASVVNGTPHYIEESLLKPIVVDGRTRDPAIPDTPTLIELAESEEERDIYELLAVSATFGRSFFFPPGVPDEAVEIMREAFEAAINDPELVAEAEKQRLNIEFVSHAELEDAIERLQNMSPETLKRGGEIMRE